MNYFYIKRFLDILFAILFLIPFVLLYIIIYLIIKIDDGGPIFYIAERLGKNGIPFKMYKFRSMKVAAADIRNNDGSTYNSEKDPRVTRIGLFLRKTSLDEIPQILNVLKGEMSFIGPRASLASSINTFKGNELDKMKVRPGITGYNQAYFRNSISLVEKRKNDAWYANNYSFLLDVKILFKTIHAVFMRDNLYTNTIHVKKK